MRTVNLYTSNSMIEGLYALADGKKATVKVNRDYLLKLLMDHSQMVKHLTTDTSYKVIEPGPKRVRLKAQ